ncbi:hypothetical protein ACFQU2_06140 [Siccirubricoccus deserti]|uniref:PepSY domain-containing protein n=1 Tax=Siccirubricoccus deserti TaxID=2013562 RepID=A0A9X0UFD0_9PROT|nr:hypothetical protein [Siccirubricoccus deserti]MBC4017801.1 hypothetical protein [Siccirubricoccus deserti]
MDDSLVRLAMLMALVGLVPSAVALASDRRGEAGLQRITGVVETVGRERMQLRREDDRPVRVDAEDCAIRAVAGETVELLGQWDKDGEFEPRRMIRPDGAVVTCRDTPLDRDRLAQVAPVNAAAAIAAAGRAGYGTVTEVEWQHGAWRLRARDASGMPMRLLVDGWSGQVTSSPWR